MLTNAPESNEVTGRGSVRAIPRWTDRYARHRALAVGFLVCATIGAAMALIMALALATALAWGRHQTALGLALLVAALAGCGAALWFALGGRLRALMETALAWADRKEGGTVPNAPTKPTKLDTTLGWVLMALMCATPMVCTLSGLPVRHLLPLTAAYTMPLIAYLCYRGQFLTPVMLLWPALYTVHSLLVLAGVPLLTHLGPMMSVLVPLIGYQLVAVLVAHLYSRYALRRLKDAARAVALEGGGASDRD